MSLRSRLNKLGQRSASYLLVAAVAAASILAAGPARGQTTFATYSFTTPGTTPVSYSTSTSGGTTTASFSGTAPVLFNFTSGPDANTPPIAATLSLSAKSTLKVISDQGSSVEFLNRTETLTFTGTSGAFTGVNLLTVKFDGALVSSDTNSVSVLSSTALGGAIAFSSAVPGYGYLSNVALGKDLSLSFNTTNISLNTSGFFNPFTSKSGSGQFGIVPEPASMAMFGLGLLGVPMMVALRRRKLAESLKAETPVA